MKALVLIKIQTGEIKDAVHLLKRLPPVTEASMTFGLYDAYAMIRGNDLNEIGHIVATQIQPIPGISKTLTCLAIDS